MKSPDGVACAIDEAVDQWAADEGIAPDGDEKWLKTTKKEEIERALARWIRYSEYITIEFDTEAGTAKVVEN